MAVRSLRRNRGTCLPTRPHVGFPSASTCAPSFAHDRAAGSPLLVAAAGRVLPGGSLPWHAVHSGSRSDRWSGPPSAPRSMWLPRATCSGPAAAERRSTSRGPSGHRHYRHGPRPARTICGLRYCRRPVGSPVCLQMTNRITTTTTRTTRAAMAIERVSMGASDGEGSTSDARLTRNGALVSGSTTSTPSRRFATPCQAR